MIRLDDAKIISIISRHLNHGQLEKKGDKLNFTAEFKNKIEAKTQDLDQFRTFFKSLLKKNSKKCEELYKNSSCTNVCDIL